jgi:hypothetical protein
LADRSSGRALGVLVVGLDDALDELVAHDVLAAEAHEVDPSSPRGCLPPRSGRTAARRESIWVTSPVTTIFEPKPSR